jgi:hypothetical protein
VNRRKLMNPHEPKGSEEGPLTCKDLYNLTRQFVRKYYETLHSKPDVLHKFYDVNGTLCHLQQDDHVTQYYTGMSMIKEQLSQSPNWDNCKIIVEKIDHQPLLDGIGVLVCVHGFMFVLNNPGRRFSQVFVLSKNQKGYYVVRYLLSQMSTPTFPRIVLF